LDVGCCFCVNTLNRKCHIFSVNVTIKALQKLRGQTGRGHNCHEAEASNHEAEAGFGLEAKAGTRLNIPEVVLL